MFGLVYGHSFIKRFASFMRFTHFDTPFEIARRLLVSHVCPGVALRGIPGARISHTNADDIIYSLGDDEPMPHFVVLDLGTNDLEDSGPLVVATRLFDLAEKLVASGVLRVVICRILHRGMGRARCVKVLTLMSTAAINTCAL